MRVILSLLCLFVMSFAMGQVFAGQISSATFRLEEETRENHPDLDADNLKPRQAIVWVLGSGHAIKVGVTAHASLKAEEVGNALSTLAGPHGRVVYEQEKHRSLAVWRKARLQNLGQSIDLNPLREALQKKSIDPTFVIAAEPHSTMIPDTEGVMIIDPTAPLLPVEFHTHATSRQWGEFAAFLFVPGLGAVAFLALFANYQRRFVADRRRRIEQIRKWRVPFLAMHVVVAFAAGPLLRGAEAVVSAVLGDYVHSSTVSIFAYLLFAIPLTWGLDKLEYFELGTEGRERTVAILPPAPHVFVSAMFAVFLRSLVEDPLKAGNYERMLTSMLGFGAMALGLGVAYLLWRPWIRSIGVSEDLAGLPKEFISAAETCREKQGVVREIEFTEEKGFTVTPVIENRVLLLPKDIFRYLKQSEFDVAVRYALLTSQYYVWFWSMGYVVMFTPFVLAGFAFGLPQPANFIYLGALVVVCIASYPHVRKWLARSVPLRAMNKIAETKPDEADFDKYVEKAVETGEFKDYEMWDEFRAERREMRRVRTPE